MSNLTSADAFPLDFPAHIIFCIVGLAFFLYRFIKYKRVYQLLMAIAIPATLLIRAATSKAMFYAIGIAESILIIAAAVTAIIDSHKASVARKRLNSETEPDPVNAEASSTGASLDKDTEENDPEKQENQKEESEKSEENQNS